MALTRKEFLSSVVTGAAGALLLVACGGGDDDGDDTTPSCVMNGTAVDIAGNHGHTLAVAKADVTAGVAKSYDIRGSADHTHMVNLSANVFAMLQGNSTVTSNSTGASTDGHTHTITVMCV